MFIAASRHDAMLALLAAVLGRRGRGCGVVVGEIQHAALPLVDGDQQR
jgi:hypothetical protein